MTVVRGKTWWTALYSLVAIAPLVAVAALSELPGRGFVLELASALGIVALTLMGLQLVLPSRLAVVAAPLGADVALRLHRRMADVLVAAIVAHVVLVMADDLGRLGLLDPTAAPWRARAAVASCLAIVALIAMAVLRRRLGLAYARWRGWHLGLAAFAFVAAVGHTVGVNGYLTEGPLAVALALGTAVALGALVELRVLRPGRLARRPFVVRDIRAERGGATTLQLAATGHAGRPFRPGQFAWLRLADDPRRLVEHPFSYSSSAAHPARPELTIKAYDGETRALTAVRPGTRVVLDGPHGSFRPSRRAPGFVLVAGGIGITPIMSLLRTQADLGSSAPHLLVYASATWERVVFREELDELKRRLRLEVVHVLQDPPPGWPGERGRVDADLLLRHLPADRAGQEVFVCGPPGLVDGAVLAFAIAGVAPEQVHAERYVDV